MLRSVKYHLSVADQASLARTNRRLFEIAQPDLNAIPVGERISGMRISDTTEPAATIAAIDNLVTPVLHDFLFTALAAHVVQGCERLENHGYQKMDAFLKGAGEHISTGSTALQKIAASMRRIVDAETHQPPEAHQSLSQHQNPELRAKAITAIREGRPEVAEEVKLMLNDPWDKALVQATEILQSLKPPAPANAPGSDVRDDDRLAGLTTDQWDPTEFNTTSLIAFEDFLRMAPQPNGDIAGDRPAGTSLASRFSNWMRRAFQ